MTDRSSLAASARRAAAGGNLRPKVCFNKSLAEFRAGESGFHAEGLAEPVLRDVFVLMVFCQLFYQIECELAVVSGPENIDGAVKEIGPLELRTAEDSLEQSGCVLFFDGSSHLTVDGCTHGKCQQSNGDDNEDEGEAKGHDGSIVGGTRPTVYGRLSL